MDLGVLVMENIILFTMMTLFFTMMPGSDFALVMKTTLAGGRKAGIYTAWGISAGLIIHTLFAILGLSALIAQSIYLFEMVKYIGAAYLSYLGIKSFIEKPKQDDMLEKEEESAPSKKQAISFFGEAVLANVLNPKVILFYLTFIPQFVNLEKAVMPQFIMLGSIYVMLTFIWFSLLTYLLNHVKKLFASKTFQERIQKVTGILLISFGIKLVLSDR